MKRICLCGVVSGILTWPAFAGTINWANDTLFLNSSGSSVGTAGWVVQLWNAGSGGVIEWTPGGVGDDTLVQNGTVNSGDGWFFNSFRPSVGNFTAYVVAYNSGNIPSATQYAILGSGDPEAVIPSLGEIDIAWFTMNGSVAGDWQLIPEPSTIALLALGAMTLVAGRRLKKKS
ncbi:MAG: PEP-CTERM sorting domain-containing protein [Verrucomicrobiota bacterium]|nr:PEP-CTERM sorting domain-containing protein [Verrucomicrobiota bacterium]